MKYIKLALATISSILILSSFGGAVVSAAPSSGLARLDLTSSAVGEACSALTAISSTGCNNGSNVLHSLAYTVVNIMSIIIGILSVIMLLVAGFRYVTAGDDSNSVTAAKNTLIYALVGLAIAVLAQLLVHEVLNTATKVQNNSFLNNNSAIRLDG